MNAATPSWGGQAVVAPGVAPRPQPAGFAEDDAAAVQALMATDMRQQPELNDLARRMNDLDDSRLTFDARITALERPVKREGYVFKFDQELLWAFLVGAFGVLSAALVDIDTVTDWRAWTVGLVTGLVRFTIGFIQSETKKRAQPAP